MSASISALNALILFGYEIDLDGRILLAVLMISMLFGFPVLFRGLFGKK